MLSNSRPLSGGAALAILRSTVRTRDYPGDVERKSMGGK
jgi:hypothetical protein